MKHTIQIMIQEDGQVNVTGPINNEELCQEILFQAIKAVRAHNKQPTSLIKQANRIIKV